jgi:type IV pilus assembly protein PilZ
MTRPQLQEAVSSQYIDGIERRASPRAEFVVRVNYQTVDSLFSEFARNINDGGIFVETDAPQPIGTNVELEFKLPGADQPIEVFGNVVRSISPDQVESGEIAGMGIEFENLDSSVRHQINEIIQKLRSETTTEPDTSA